MTDCPKCYSSSSVSGGVWGARLFAMASEIVLGPIALAKNTIFPLLHNASGTKTAREIYRCSSCEVYFFTCPSCAKGSILNSFPTQGSTVTCRNCDKMAVLRLD
jgi:hypothetical protein